IHTGEWPHNCGECGKSFRDSSRLITHWRMHTREQPYVCSECGKKAWSSSVLLKHQHTHTGERPSCCRKGFTLNFSLLTHQCIHT
ncbi:ZN416 protein, partial [Chloropsis hardwickii]|nr:ZN416 protein [Chloropsis hardwickii]